MKKNKPIVDNAREVIRLGSLFFFDDNVHKKIIKVDYLNEDCLNQLELHTELIASGRIVPVNTLKVCDDENYFINAFKKVCEPLNENSSVLQQGSLFNQQIKRSPSSETVAPPYQPCESLAPL